MGAGKLNFQCGWLTDNNAMSWPHLASWDLLEFQLSWNYKMGPRVSFPGWKLIILAAFLGRKVEESVSKEWTATSMILSSHLHNHSAWNNNPLSGPPPFLKSVLTQGHLYLWRALWINSSKKTKQKTYLVEIARNEHFRCASHLCEKKHARCISTT